MIEIAGEHALHDLVELRQVRQKRSYARNGTVVEVSVDDVEVLVGQAVAERFAELELELREGDEVELEPLADMLAEIEELVAVDSSKFERALEVVRREPREAAIDDAGPNGAADADERTSVDTIRRPAPKAAKGGPGRGRRGGGGGARRRVGRRPSRRPLRSRSSRPSPVPELPRILVPKSPGVLADDHIAEAGRKVLRFHLARMVAREAGTREGRTPRSCTRCASRPGGSGRPGACSATRSNPSGRPATASGCGSSPPTSARSATSTSSSSRSRRYQHHQAPEEAAALEPLVRSWRVRRETSREVLVRELDSDRYRRWLDGYLAFVQTEGQGVHAVGPTEPHRVRDTMPSRVWSAYEALRAYDAVMRWADVATLHELRIAAKWLRYTLEFVREALGRDAGPVIEKVVALQDHLGWLHDADVAAGLARGFLVEHAGDLTEVESAAIGRYLVDRERTLAKLRRTVGVPWRGVSSLAFRRSLGRLVAGL